MAATQTVAECDKRHSRLWLAFKVGGALLTLMVALISIFSTIAYRASVKAAEADKAVTAVQTEVTTALPFITKALGRIEKKVDGINGGSE